MSPFPNQLGGDPYLLLGLEAPTEPGQYGLKEIKQAYRRKALELHPDKNPDDPEAAAKFNRLGVILEYLSNDTNRAKLDERLVEQAARRARMTRVDMEKKRLAAELKRREAEHKAAQAAQSDAQFISKAFSRRTADDPRRWEKLKKQADLDRLLLKDLAAKRTEVAKVPKQVPKHEVDLTHFYILTLQWHPGERGMEPSRCREVLEKLLKPPYSIITIDPHQGHAHIQFLTQSAALAAAMTFTVIEDDTPEFKSTGLSPNAVFSARVIKKPRTGKRSGHVQRSVADEEEYEKLLEAKMASDLAAHERAAKERELARKRIETFDVVSDEEGEEEEPPLIRPISVPAMPSTRPIAASLLNRLKLPTPKIQSAPPVQPVTVDDSSDSDLVDSTLAMLREAVSRKKPRLS